MESNRSWGLTGMECEQGWGLTGMECEQDWVSQVWNVKRPGVSQIWNINVTYPSTVSPKEGYPPCTMYFLTCGKTLYFSSVVCYMKHSDTPP